MKTHPLDILKTYWGYSSFKPPQKDAITSVLEGKDTCVFLPTGGGKSLCFQVPSLAMEGICIVISPLIALMQDQVENLKSRGIKAELLKSGMHYSEIDQKLDNCIYGNYKFLYLSPERLQQDIVQQRIGKMNVNLIAVDEAHCISQWGHDFRPAYREIHILRELHPLVSIIALTATATHQVKLDIQEQLQLKDATCVEESFERDNISFVKKASNDKMNDLYEVLQNAPPSQIVYVRNRSSCKEISKILNKKGLKSTYFHGGITQTEKQNRLASWLAEKHHIIIATNAFGMGIDKANVRQVIHFHLPESLESYYQEAGRAGRDGLASKAIMLYNESDKLRLHNQFIKSIPTFESVQLIYKALMSNFQLAFGEGENETFDFNFIEFCTKYKLHSILTYNTLNLLDRLSVISLDKSFQKQTKLKFLVSSQHLIHFIEHNTSYALLVRTLLRTYGGVFEEELRINIQLLKKKTGLNETEIFSQLKALEHHGLLSALFIKQDLSITFIKPREDKYTLNPLKKYVLDYQHNKLKKAEAVVNYVEEDSQCLQNYILKYFGETPTHTCGRCSYCLNQSNSELKESREAYTKVIKQSILAFLNEKDYTSKEIIEHCKFPKHLVLETLQLLLEDQKIKLTAKNTYKTII